jgi:hypothetical protein
MLLKGSLHVGFYSGVNKCDFAYENALEYYIKEYQQLTSFLS